VPDGIRIMVVDDTEHVRKMLVTMLDLDGFAVVGDYGSGEEAVTEVDAVDPDVIVIDYKMPAMDGLETARRIRAQRPEQAVILYTAFVDDALEAEARKVGVAVCLGKVEGLGSLEREITRLCGSLF
jgi:DNA-binding NarL/FixJ family response regulator